MMKREGMSDNKRNFAYRRSSGGNSLGPERSPSRDEDEDTKVHRVIFTFKSYEIGFATYT